jgi:hypothetical protein
VRPVALRNLLYFKQIAPGYASRRKFAQCQISISNDGGQEIVEIVRDAAGKPADAFYFLGLEELCFEALLLINLLAQHDFTLRYSGKISEQRDFVSQHA